MTPDEFDQKRRELIAMRVKYAGNEAVTNRISNLIGQLGEIRTATGLRELNDRIERTMRELSQLTADQ